MCSRKYSFINEPLQLKRQIDFSYGVSPHDSRYLICVFSQPDKVSNRGRSRLISNIIDKRWLILDQLFQSPISLDLIEFVFHGTVLVCLKCSSKCLYSICICRMLCLAMLSVECTGLDSPSVTYSSSFRQAVPIQTFSFIKVASVRCDGCRG